MQCGIFDFALCNTYREKCDQVLKMPSIYPQDLVQANHNPISTSDVGIHIVLAVGWHVGLAVGPEVIPWSMPRSGRGCVVRRLGLPVTPTHIQFYLYLGVIHILNCERLWSHVRLAYHPIAHWRRE